MGSKKLLTYGVQTLNVFPLIATFYKKETLIFFCLVNSFLHRCTCIQIAKEFDDWIVLEVLLENNLSVFIDPNRYIETFRKRKVIKPRGL